MPRYLLMAVDMDSEYTYPVVPDQDILTADHTSIQLAENLVSAGYMYPAPKVVFAEGVDLEDFEEIVKQLQNELQMGQDL